MRYVTPTLWAVARGAALSAKAPSLMAGRPHACRHSHREDERLQPHGVRQQVRKEASPPANGIQRGVRLSRCWCGVCLCVWSVQDLPLRGKSGPHVSLTAAGAGSQLFC